MSDFNDGYGGKTPSGYPSGEYKKGQDARDAHIKNISTPFNSGGSGGSAGGCLVITAAIVGAGMIVAVKLFS